MPKRKAKRKVRRYYLEPLTNRQYETQRRVFDALVYSRANPKQGITSVAKQMGTTLKTIRRYASGALDVTTRRIRVKRSDQIPRTLEFITRGGNVPVTVHNFRDASRIAKHRNAARRAIITFGTNTTKLGAFDGQSIRAEGNVYPFITDYETLNRLARAGALDFTDIYVSPGALQ